MILNKASIQAIFMSLKVTFNKAFENTTTVWQEIAMLSPSTTSQNVYVWFDKFPRMRRWVGEKLVKSLKAFKYTIENEDFEATVAVDRNDIEDDQLGQYTVLAQSAGESSRQLPDELVGEAVNGVFANECFDGQYVCDTDHPVGDGTVSNKITAVLSVATQALADASLGAAISMMEQFKDEEGRPLGCKPTVLLVGPALRMTATALLTNDRLEDGKPNPYKNALKLVVSPWITSTTAWFVLDTSKAIKPFIYQERKKAVFVSQTSMEADSVFSHKEYKFGAEARGASGYGFWQLIVGSTGAG